MARLAERTRVDADAVERVRALVAGARRLVDATSELGRRARRLLAESTGLSAENVAWGLEVALETGPTDDEIHAFCRNVATTRGDAPGERTTGSQGNHAAHVILPANVFVAAHRALALALASSARVFVRPSRREPVFTALLAEAAPDLFTRVDELAPAAGDELWAYGGERSLTAIQASLPAGTVLHAQGPGYGIAVVDASAANEAAAAALARDIAAFDQRGCLSPRAAVVVGAHADAQRFAALLASALMKREREVPLGRLDALELAEIRRFRDAATYTGALVTAGAGGVLVTDRVKLGVAPIGRHLTISAAPSFAAALLEMRAELVTAVGLAATDDVTREVSTSLPGARVSALGRMQQPDFDGPADRRGESAGR